MSHMHIRKGASTTLSQSATASMRCAFRIYRFLPLALPPFFFFFFFAYVCRRWKPVGASKLQACLVHPAFSPDCRTLHGRFTRHSAHMFPPRRFAQDKTGAVVYYEQLGKIDDKALRRRGLDGKEMLWHYMYQVGAEAT